MINRLTGLFHHLRNHQLTKRASWILAGQAANFFIQAAYFLLLARLLGSTEYGIFAGAFALVSIVTPYSSLGSGLLFMRYVTADRSAAAVYWGNSMLLTTVMTVVLAVASGFIGPAVTNTHDITMLVELVISNCLFYQAVINASRVFQTFEKMRHTSFLLLLCNFTRLLVLVVMVLTLHRGTAGQWALGTMIASGVAFLIAIAMVQKAIGGVTFDPRLMIRRLWEGLGFSVAATSSALYNDVDKTLLSHYGLNTENGFYTLAYRVIDFATVPVQAMDTTLLPRYFQLSQKGLAPVFRLAMKSVITIVAASLVIAAGIWVIAPFVPMMVGHDFGGVLVALRWLALIPMFRGIHTISGGALTGLGKQHVRLVAQMIVAAVNLGLNIWLIPRVGWIGAAWASLASDGLLAVLNISLLTWLWMTRPRNEAPTSTIEAVTA